jgi:hypothetical protein
MAQLAYQDPPSPRQGWSYGSGLALFFADVPRQRFGLLSRTACLGGTSQAIGDAPPFR